MTMITKNVTKKIVRIQPLIVAVSAVSLLLSGCGGSDQDEGASSRVQVSGLGLDGYLARAEVFQDKNNNGTRESFESVVYTDDDGYYGYNPLTDVNYCSSSTAVALYDRHCLQAEIGAYPIVIRGGYDLSTGEPFFGNMRKNVNVTPDRVPTTLDIITPISTLLSYVSEADQIAIKVKLGLTEDDLNRDFLNRSSLVMEQPLDNAKDKHLVKITQQLHKTISAAAKITENRFKVADEASLPQDTTPYIYESIAQHFADPSVINMASIIEDTVQFSEVMDRVKDEIENDYTDNNLTLPSVSLSDLGLDNNGNLNANSLENVTKIAAIVDAVVNQLADEPPTTISTQASAKAIEVSVSKVAKNKATAELDGVITTLNNATELQILLTELEKPSTNIASLADVNISDSAAVSAVTVIDYPAVFTNLGSKRLVLSESDISAQQDMSALLYFSADSESATSGTLVACVRFVDGLNSDNTLKSGGTLGTYSDVGTWSQLNAGYAVILDFDVVGAKRQATIQYGGLHESSEHIFRTDIGDGLTTWTGPEIPSTYQSVVPSSDATCRAELESVDPIVGFTVVE